MGLLSNPLKSIPAWSFLAIATVFKVIPIKLKEAQTIPPEFFTHWNSLISLFQWTETWKVVVIAFIIFSAGYLVGELIKLVKKNNGN